MSLLLRKPGAFTLLVDHGRPGTRHLGVPRSGAADVASFTLANALAGNDTSAPALEISLAGPTLEATDNHSIALIGIPFALWLNNKPMSSQRMIQLREGDILRIGSPLKKGMRCYLAVPGGFRSEPILGSVSSFQPIPVGAELSCETSSIPNRFVRISSNGSLDSLYHLRLLPGTHLKKSVQRILENDAFEICPNSNRMGLRLHHPTTLPAEQKELHSAPVVPGTMQLPPGGQPIILGVDAQAIGGYPRIAHVIKADLDKLAQLAAGDEVRFSFVKQEEAEEYWNRRQRWLKDWKLRFLISTSGKYSPC